MSVTCMEFAFCANWIMFYQALFELRHWVSTFISLSFVGDRTDGFKQYVSRLLNSFCSFIDIEKSSLACCHCSLQNYWCRRLRQAAIYSFKRFWNWLRQHELIEHKTDGVSAFELFACDRRAHWFYAQRPWTFRRFACLAAICACVRSKESRSGIFCLFRHIQPLPKGYPGHSRPKCILNLIMLL